MALMEFLRAVATESSANTYFETQINAPTSRGEFLAMLIWRANLDVGRPDLEDGQSNSVQAHLADRTSAAIRALEDRSTIWRAQRDVVAGAVEGTLSEYVELREIGTETQYFDPPILYTRDDLFLGVVGTGNAGVKSASLQLGYTLEKVSTADFIAALVE